MEIKSSYLHIPFCVKKCKYCSFLSFEDLGLKDFYIEKLLDEIDCSAAQETIYIGGGTPSSLSLSDFEKIFSRFKLAANAEVTVEINPNGIELAYLQSLRELGVNRLSVGVQSFNDKILNSIGRLHSAAEAVQTLNFARDAGFQNISIDLIYGLPGQDLALWEKDLHTAQGFSPEHISLYGLKIDEDCEFYKKPPKVPDDDLQADMYLCALKILKDYNHYEISNFARKGFEGKHNLNYWKLGYYNGFGVGASGFLPEGRHSNTGNARGWEKVWEETDPLSEEIFLGFRLFEGINVSSINKKYNIDFEKKYSRQLKKFLNTNYMQKTKNGYRLSVKGILISNSILCEFM